MTRPEASLIPTELQMDAAAVLAALQHEAAHPTTIDPGLSPEVLSQSLEISQARVNRALGEMRGRWVCQHDSTGNCDLMEPAQALMVHQDGERSHPRWRIDMPLRQAQLLRECLEMAIRVCIGQVGEIQNAARSDGLAFGPFRPSFDTLDRIGFLTERLQFSLTGLERGASFGIYNPSLHADTLHAWFIQKLLRHRLAWDWTWARGDIDRSFLGVHHDEPLEHQTDGLVLVHSRSDDGDASSDEQHREATAQPSGSVTLVLRKTDARRAFRLMDLGARILQGDLQVLLEMARDGLIPHANAGGARDLTQASIWLGELEKLLPNQPSDGTARALAMDRLRSDLDALRSLVHAILTEAANDAAPDRLDGRIIATTMGVNEVFVPDDLPMFPPGIFLGHHKGKFELANIAPDGVLVNFDRSHSLQTAAIYAWRRYKHQSIPDQKIASKAMIR